MALHHLVAGVVAILQWLSQLDRVIRVLMAPQMANMWSESLIQTRMILRLTIRRNWSHSLFLISRQRP